MSKQDIETRIETLKMAVAINSGFLKLVAPGADKATERQVDADKEELAKLRAEEGNEEQAHEGAMSLSDLITKASALHSDASEEMVYSLGDDDVRTIGKMVDALKLIRDMAQRWRDQADAIRREYGDDVPHGRECVALAIEQSADELEAVIGAPRLEST